MKIRIISDLHLDVNQDHLHLFEWADRDVLTILAGDISGSLEKTAEFVRARFNNAIIIGGNHIVYNYEHKTIGRLHADYRAEFPLDAPISYLENDYKMIEDVVFIGATLWTDYGYKWDVQENMERATIGLNDFRWGIFTDPNGAPIPLRPQHCLDMFNESLAFIKDTYDKFEGEGKKIVLIVHHAVSPQALAERYKTSPLNASFISNLEDYIKTNLPNLALIIHGHVHNRCRYKIGNVPVICNPCGYIGYGEMEETHAWDKDLVVEI